MDINRISRMFIPVALLIIFLVLPTPEGLSWEGKAMFGVLAFAASLFILQPIPLGLSGVLVLIMPMLLGIKTASEVFMTFGNSAVFFLIGAFIIAAAIEQTGVHKIISLLLLRVIGRSPKGLILAAMISGASMSLIMPEHGVIILIVPVLMVVLVGMGTMKGTKNLKKAVMIGAAYGCSIGSIITPLGGARNPLTIGFLDSQGIEVNFLQWVVMSLPIAILSIGAVWLILIKIFPTDVDTIDFGRDFVQKEIDHLNGINRNSVLILTILAVAILSWVILPFLIDVSISVIALIAGAAMFIGGRLKWEVVERRIPWGIVLLYGGAISMGIHLAETGAAVWLADRILSMTDGSVFLTILLLILITKILTELMSNTAAVSIVLPVAYGTAMSLDINPLITTMVVGLSGGLAFMFLISTPGNLISYSSGFFSQKDLMKAGIIANIITVLITLTMVFTLWKWFGVW